MKNSSLQTPLVWQFIFTIAAILLSYSLISVSFADATFVIVRHGEKPEMGLGQLSCQGLNWAMALPRILIDRYGTPAAIYAPNPSILKKDHGTSYAYVRPLETIEPLAIQVGLPVQLAGGMTDLAPLIHQLTDHPHGTQVIAWEHHWAERLARQLLLALGGDPSQVKSWDNHDFDRISVIRVRDAAGGKTEVTYTQEQEGLNGLPPICGH